MGVIRSLLAAIGLLDKLEGWFHDRRERKAGRNEAENEQMRETLERSGQVRRLRDRLDADPDERKRVRDAHQRD